MQRPPRRTLLLALVLIGAVAALYWSWGKTLGARPMMIDRPCPARPLAEEIIPIRDDWVELCRYRAANARLLAAGEPVVAVILGDSISEWWQDEDPSLFTRGIVNRGITGQTSQQLVLRFRQDVLALKPKAVVFQAGLNDVMGNTGMTGPDDYIANFETLIDLAEAHGIAPVIASLPAVREIPGRSEIPARQRVSDLNRRLQALAARRGAIYADLYAPLAGPDGAPREGLSSDGVHLTRAGYALLRPVLERAIAAALAEKEGTRP